MKLLLSMGQGDLKNIVHKNLDYMKKYKGGLLLSYLDIRNNSEAIMGMIRNIKKINPELVIMIDSGAHSFIHLYSHDVLNRSVGMGHETNKEAAKIMKHKGMDKFVDEYALFMYRYRSICDIFVELDLQLIYGMKKIIEWRNICIESCGADKFMVVWHGESFDTITNWAEKFPLIGVGGTGGNISGEDKAKFIRQVIPKYPDNKFHLFGLTGNDLAMYSELGLYSADSTSWTMGARFGLLYIFNKNKMVMKPKYFLRNDKTRPNIMNLLAWIQYGNYLNDIGMFKTEGENK